MASIAIFFLGILNFALHKAVLESGHPMLEHMGWRIFANGGRLSLAAELLLLVIALFFARYGYAAAGWFYAAYTGGNALAAYLVITRKI